jgi:hypothetical protein
LFLPFFSLCISFLVCVFPLFLLPRVAVHRYPAKPPQLERARRCEGP